MPHKLKNYRLRPLGYALLGLGMILLGLAVWYLFSQFIEAVQTYPSSKSSGSGLFTQSAVSDMSGYTSKEWDSIRFREGPLILVNSEHGTEDVDGKDLTALYGNKTDSYQVKDTAVSVHKDVLPHLNSLLDGFRAEKGDSDILALSGFRSWEKQKELYDADLAGSGKLYSDQTAKPGNSEHETGYAMDFSLFTRFGITLDYTGRGKYRWIEENAFRYGFILRYSDEKKEITKTMGEPWHYRFVGYPHAFIMKEKGYCLEEYIEYLHGFPFGGEHLFVEDGGGKKYEIYFVKAGPEEKTELPVPSARRYEVSGDNVDGFIVTAEV